MTTVSKVMPQCVLHVFKGLAFEETVELLLQDEGGNVTKYDITGKTVTCQIKTSSDADTVIKSLTTADGSLVAGVGELTIKAFSRAESAALEVDTDLIGLIVLEDSPTRDIPLLNVAFSVQNGI